MAADPQHDREQVIEVLKELPDHRPVLDLAECNKQRVFCIFPEQRFLDPAFEVLRNDVAGKRTGTYAAVRGGYPGEWIVKLILGTQGQQGC